MTWRLFAAAGVVAWVCLWILCIGGFQSTSEVSDSVVNELDQPIPDAVVTLAYDSIDGFEQASLLTSTDEDGWFRVGERLRPMKRGVATLRCSAEGYQPVEQRFRIGTRPSSVSLRLYRNPAP